MRTLELNKQTFWIVNKLGKVPEIIDGLRTGVYITGYSEPTQVGLNIYPSDGKIEKRIFGKELNFDMIAVSTDVILTEDTIIFDVEPLEGFDTEYLYSVDKINKSLNSYTYGLSRRV